MRSLSQLPHLQAYLPQRCRVNVAQGPLTLVKVGRQVYNSRPEDHIANRAQPGTLWTAGGLQNWDGSTIAAELPLQDALCAFRRTNG